MSWWPVGRRRLVRRRDRPFGGSLAEFDVADDDRQWRLVLVRVGVNDRVLEPHHTLGPWLDLGRLRVGSRFVRLEVAVDQQGRMVRLVRVRMRMSRGKRARECHEWPHDESGDRPRHKSMHSGIIGGWHGPRQIAGPQGAICPSDPALIFADTGLCSGVTPCLLQFEVHGAEVAEGCEAGPRWLIRYAANDHRPFVDE